MKIIKDLVPTDEKKLYRYEVRKASDPTVETSNYIFLKYNPGELAQTPTAINAALIEDLYGYTNETITVNTDGSVVCTSDGITETTTVLADGTVQTVKTDGTKTITVTLTVSDDGTITTEVS